MATEVARALAERIVGEIAERTPNVNAAWCRDVVALIARHLEELTNRIAVAREGLRALEGLRASECDATWATARAIVQAYGDAHGREWVTREILQQFDAAQREGT